MRTVLCDMTNKTIMAAAREVTPYIRLRSGFTMIKKRSGDGAGPAMDREDIILSLYTPRLRWKVVSARIFS